MVVGSMLAIKKLINSNTGSAGLLALLGMMFFGIIGGAYITLSNSGVQTSAALRDGIAAQYLAEAGAHWALAQLRSNPNFENDNQPVTVAKNQGTMTAGSYCVRVKGDSPANKTIISEGTVNKTTRTVVLKTNGSVFDKAIYAKGEMTINGGAISGKNKITGSIGSNDKIIISGGTADTISKGSKIYCKTFEDYSGRINNEKRGELPKEENLDIDKLMKNKPLFTKKGVDLQAISNNGSIKSYLLERDNYYHGSYLMDEHDPLYTVPTGQAATIYVDGNFQVSKDIVGDDITVFVNGNLTFTNGASIKPTTLNSNSRMNIYATGNIEWNSTIYQGKGIIVAKGNIDFNSGASGEYTMLISGGDIQVNSNSKVGALYANGKVSLADGATANYENIRGFITELQLNTPIVSSWSDKES